MAQPPLSQAIRKLESELGVVLVERTTRVVNLTGAGRVLAAQARHVLSTVDVAITETRRAGGVGCGLRIGFTPHLPIEQLLLFLGALQVREPGARTEVTHALAVKQLDSLDSGGLDVAVLPWANDKDGLQIEPIFPGEPLAAFLPAEHPLAERGTLGPAELSAETLVSFPRNVNPALSDWLRSQRERSGYRFRDLREVDGQHPRDWILAVASGSGVALLPHRFKEFADAGELVTRHPLSPRLTMPDSVLAWLTDHAGEGPLIAAARSVARELRGRRD